MTETSAERKVCWATVTISSEGGAIDSERVLTRLTEHQVEKDWLAALRGKKAVREIRISLWFAVICEVWIMAGSGQAQDQSNTMSAKLASHTYVIPRDILEGIYKPQYGANPNPNWSTEPIIRIVVRWPDLKAGKPGEDLVNITLANLAVDPIVPIEQVLINLNKANLQPRIEPAQYGLEELRSRLTTDPTFHQFIARPNNFTELFIRCPNIMLACEFEFKFTDAKAHIFFRGDNIKEWEEIYNKTVSLLSSLQND